MKFVIGELSRLVVIALLIGQLVAPTSLVALDQKRRLTVIEVTETADNESSMKDSELEEVQNGIEALSKEIEEAEEHQVPEYIPDPYHLSQQYLLSMRKDGNRSDRYHLVGTAGGLPTVSVRPDKVEVIEFDGYLAFRYQQAVHVVESIRPLVMASDPELLVVIDEQGDVYAIDMSFARGELLFKAPVPIHKTLMTVPVSHFNESLALSYVTRGLNPFTQFKSADREIKKLTDQRRFVAGDLVLWQKDGDQRMLIEVISRDSVVTEINNGNYFLASLIYQLRKDRPSELAITKKLEEQGGQQPRDTDDLAKQLPAQTKQIMQGLDAKRIQRMVLRDVAINSYRDSFTYSDWQRDYLMIKHQAQIVIEELEESVSKKYKIVKDLTDQQKLDSLKEQLRKGDFSASWFTLSESRVEDLREMVIDRITVLKSLGSPEASAKIAKLQEILDNYDYQRLWVEPQLLVDHGTGEVSPFRLKVERFRYQHLSSDDLTNIASTIAGVGLIAGGLYASAWALKAGFSLKSLIPASLTKKASNLPPRPKLSRELRGTAYNSIRHGYRKHLIWASVAGIILIPIVGFLGFLSARATGQDWDYRKQLTLFGMRTYSTLALPFWHYLSNLTGQTTLMPAMAAQVSPFETVDGSSAVGQSLGLKEGESIRVGFRNPFSTSELADDESLRRRAIAVLQRQRVRAQAIGWEMAANIVASGYLFGKKVEEIDGKNLDAEVQKDEIKQGWKKLAIILEQQTYQLYKEGVFQDLRLVTTDDVYSYLKGIKPELLIVDGGEDANFVDDLKKNTNDVVGWLGRQIATVTLDDFTFLQTADPDDFISSEVFTSFMIDFISVVIWETTYGARSKVFHPKVSDPKTSEGIGHLAATNRFPYWGGEHSEMLLGQVYAHQVSAQGRYSLIFSTLESVATNYRPMAEILFVGRDNPQSMLAGLLGFSKDAVDFRNLDVGSKYIRSLVVATTMLQAGLLYALFSKSLLVGIPLKSVLPQHLFNFWYGLWAFAWPWIYYYTTRQLGEQKLDLRNNMFGEAKVRMTMHESQHRQQGYQELVATYRQFYDGQPPAVLIAKLRRVEDSLQIEDRLPAKGLLPYFGLLVRLSATESPVEKRNIYRQIVNHIDNAIDYQPTDQDLEQVLEFVMHNPAFPSKISKSVSYVGIATVAIVTTWLGSRFHRKGFAQKTYGDVAPYMIKGILLFAVVGLALNKEHSRKIIDFVREKILGYPEDSE